MSKSINRSIQIYLNLSKNLSIGTKMLSFTTGWRQISKYNFWRPIKRLKLYWQLWLRFLLNIRIKVKSHIIVHRRKCIVIKKKLPGQSSLASILFLPCVQLRVSDHVIKCCVVCIAVQLKGMECKVALGST